MTAAAVHHHHEARSSAILFLSLCCLGPSLTTKNPNKIMCAAEAAEKQALHATSGAAARMVSNKFGENAGEATEDVLATAGHCAGTAWNILRIRRAINPTATASSGVLKNTRRTLKS